MADTAVHAANARNYIAIAVELFPSNAAIAGEDCWGAAVQAAQAFTHARGRNAAHPQSYGGIIDAINQLPVSQSVKSYWLKVANDTVSHLHGGFYRPDTITSELHADAIADTRRLVLALLHAAQT